MLLFAARQSQTHHSPVRASPGQFANRPGRELANHPVSSPVTRSVSSSVSRCVGPSPVWGRTRRSVGPILIVRPKGVDGSVDSDFE
ncbi:unnamed protein product [Calypogeia fissa]